MAILKLKPSCKDYLWGGTRLMTEFGKEYDGDKLAETWKLPATRTDPAMWQTENMPEKHSASISSWRERRLPVLTAAITASFRC